MVWDKSRLTVAVGLQFGSGDGVCRVLFQITRSQRGLKWADTYKYRTRLYMKLDTGT
jgi:hypothetical protein